MTMRFLVNQKFGSTNTMPQLLFAWLDFMRTASPLGPGWTISRSSNGLIGGGGDNIAIWTDLNVFTANVARSWFVLRSPDGNREWLFRRESTDNRQWAIYANKYGDSSGGGVWDSPGGSWTYVTGDDNGTINISIVAHFAADDAAPYGWWVYSYAAGSLTNARWSLSQIPLDVASDPADDDPTVWFYNGGTTTWDWVSFCQIDAGTYVAYVGGIKVGTVNSWLNYPAMILYSYGGRAVPGYVDLTVAGKDVTFPMSFIRRSSANNGGFKGSSTWARWNGYSRSVGDTFDDLARISLGDVNVPWDGVSSMDLS